MALVRVTWVVAKTYEGEIEVDGFDSTTGEPGELRDAVGQIEDLEYYEQPGDDGGIDILGHEVVREGDQPIEVKVAAPNHEPDFDL